MTKRSGDKVTIGSGNIFADTGQPHADMHLLKAQLVAELYRLMAERKLTQTAAGKVLGISQPEISRMFHGHFREYSVERLMEFLTRFNCDVEIISKPAKPKKMGALRFIQGCAAA